MTSVGLARFRFDAGAADAGKAGIGGVAFMKACSTAVSTHGACDAA